MLDEFLDGIEQAVDVVDQAIFSNDFSTMSRDIGNIFEEQTKRRQEEMAARAEAMRAQQPSWASGHKKQRKKGDPPSWMYEDGRGGKGNAAQNRTVYQHTTQQSRTYGTSYNRSTRTQRTTRYEYSSTDHAERIKDRFAARGKQAPEFIRKMSSNGAKATAICGIAGMLIFLLPGMSFLTDYFILKQFFGALMIVVAALFGWLGVTGIFQMKKVKHLAAYAALLEEKKYAPVEQLAEAAGISEKKAVKELKKMVAEGVFPQGHFDSNEKTFMITDEVFGQYQEVQKKSDELKKNEEAENAAYAGYEPKVQKMLKKGKDYAAHIREANDDIADPEVTAKLNRMEMIIKRIFEAVAEKPERADKLNVLMDYYMPTTEKLIDAYRNMIKEPIQGDSIKQAEHEIENSLDTFNEGFEGILDGFFEDEAMDLSTDISVMKTVMRQQGITEGELKAEQAATGSWENGPTLDELKDQIEQQAKELALEEVHLK